MSNVITEETDLALQEELFAFFRACQPRQLRTMREFAEQEIILPTGPHKGWLFSAETQPFAKLWFEAVESGKWNRFMATGCQQSGKTLLCFVIVILYFLFESRETVVVGVPNGQMAKDKWVKDILPAIMASQTFKDQLPEKGPGSQGGYAESITFKNGATLRFMTGGSDDKAVAGFTARIIVITEVDGMDKPGETSREADKITQIEGRARAFGPQKMVFLECTVSIKEGRTWQEYTHGTESRIFVQCCGCKEWVTLERDNLRGWDGAENIKQAMSRAGFSCPGCGEFWTEEERFSAHQNAKLLHRGQSCDRDGNVAGDAPETNTLGFLWNAGNNFLCPPSQIGGEEWDALQNDPFGNKEKALRQFVWAIPLEPESIVDAPLDAQVLMRRVNNYEKGVVPSVAKWLTMGVDIGKFLIHWSLRAWKPDGTSYVVQYGRKETGADHLGVDRGIFSALREFRDSILSGWPCGDINGSRKIPDQVWIDSGYCNTVIYAFCVESGTSRFKPIIGRGVGQRHKDKYWQPQDSKKIIHAGEEYHISPHGNVPLVEINVDHWKSWMHQRLSVPATEPGAMTLHSAQPNEHVSWAKHVTSERQVQAFEDGRGTVIKWEPIRPENHFLDADNYNGPAGHYCGARLIIPKPVVVKPPEPRPILTMPDGRPYLITER